ncbi:MAG: outer membrane protein assembly factor BamC [Gammaproteobacteria bacterium]
MKLINNILLILMLLLVAACDYMPRLDEVIPDRRTEYKKSEAMPDLEVPPDLTVNADTDPMTIPKEEATTLSEFESRKKMRQGGAGAPVALGDEQWLTVQGGTAEIWPKLQEFWSAKGYTLDLDDQELGVLETHWLEAEQEGMTASRTKFSIFAEPGTAPGSTVLFLTSHRQEKIAAQGEEANWVDIEGNIELEKQMIGELNLHFYGNKPPSESASVARAAESATARTTSSKPVPSKPRAEVLNLGEDKVYLSLPEEFNRAWTMIETAILDAGMFIDNKDRAKGLYYVTYNGVAEEPEKKGLLSKLKFWGDKEEPKAYQISLTGVGDKTELVVLSEKGDWAQQEEATRILTLLQGQYNSAR